jgi:hypothetical protein
MAVKITQNTTDNTAGQISISDVFKQLNDFITKVQLSCTDPTRNPIQKHYSFDIKMDRINQVIEGTIGAVNDKIRINLSLNLPDQLNCHNTASIENYLSILICAVDENGAALLKEDAMILAEGFADFGGLTQTDCCVQGTPPYGTV